MFPEFIMNRKCENICKIKSEKYPFYVLNIIRIRIHRIVLCKQRWGAENAGEF